MKKLHICIGIGLLLLTALFTACAQVTEQAHSEERPPKIGIAFDTFVVERWQRDLEILVAALTEQGAEVDVQIANEDQNKQIEQIRYLIGEKVDVLIIVPNDGFALTDVVDEAKREGIKVIAYDRLIMNANIDLYVSFDNEAIGRSIAQRLVDALNLEVTPNPINLIMINGDPKDYNATLMNKGYYDVLRPMIENGDLIILEEVWAPEWREVYAKETVDDVLSQGRMPDGIIAANDHLAMGAIETLSKWQLAGNVLVVGQDAELSACQRIVEKTQLATVYKPIVDLATTVAKLSIQLANGESLETEDVLGNTFKNVPYVRLKTFMIDAANLDELIIESGFHRREDVYLNIQD